MFPKHTMSPVNQPRHVLGAGAVLLYGCAPRHPPDADTPRQAELQKNEPRPPPPPERAPPKTIRWDSDYTRDEPPTVQRMTEEPLRHSTPRAATISPSDRGNHSSYYATARTGKDTRHCHRGGPRDSATSYEAWQE